MFRAIEKPSVSSTRLPETNLNMKTTIIFFALCVITCSISAQNTAETVRYVSDNIGVDGYNFDVETSDGKRHSEQGVLQNAGTDNEAIAVTGQFSYPGNDGNTYSVTYTAGENGFQPQGDHLPTPPPIPSF